MGDAEVRQQEAGDLNEDVKGNVEPDDGNDEDRFTRPDADRCNDSSRAEDRHEPEKLFHRPGLCENASHWWNLNFHEVIRWVAMPAPNMARRV